MAKDDQVRRSQESYRVSFQAAQSLEEGNKRVGDGRGTCKGEILVGLLRSRLWDFVVRVEELSSPQRVEGAVVESRGGLLKENKSNFSRRNEVCVGGSEQRSGKYTMSLLG